MNWEAAFGSFWLMVCMVGGLALGWHAYNWIEAKFGWKGAAWFSGLAMICLVSLAIGLICAGKPLT